MTYKRQTEGEWSHDSETPSNVAKDFEKLFGITRRNSADETLKSSQGLALANAIFKVKLKQKTRHCQVLIALICVSTF